MNFPLAAGHFFGHTPLEVRCHVGDNFADSHNLSYWQGRYARLWDREQTVTGKFDGPTQRACLAVQRAKGLPLTGHLDEDTWKLGLAGPTSPESPARAEAVPQEVAESREAQNRSETVAPGRPAWMPPKGVVDATSDEKRIRKVRALLGAAPGSKWTADITRRVKGLQRLAELSETGSVDEATARLLDARAAGA